MESLFSYISKKSIKVLKSAQLSHALFVDTSGSTCHYFNSHGVKYIDVELEIVQLFKHKSIPTTVVGWSNNATVAVNGQFKIERGGTNPSCIFNNEAATKAFTEARVLVFLTDGQISQSSVELFAQKCENNLQKTLILCGLIYKDAGSQNNISVFAPLLKAPNVLCFHYDGQVKGTARVIMSQGSVSSIMPAEKNFLLEDLCNISISDIYTNIPKNNLVCNETDTEIMSVNLKAFIAYVNTDKCAWKDISSHVEKMDWSIILRDAKVTGATDVIRTVINKLKHLQAEYVKTLVKSDHTMPQCVKRDALVEKVVEMRENGEDYSHLRTELTELINSARLEEYEFATNIKQRMVNATKIWDGIKAELYEIEKGSYSLNDFIFSSNRANRAKKVSSEGITDLENILVHDNVPEIECCIHLDQGPAVLWIQTPENQALSSTDHCLNFPLDSYPMLQSSLVVNPICGYCASGYVKAMANKYDNHLKTVYNVPVNGYIPLNFARNTKFIAYTLHNTLGGGKVLSHVKSLLLSIVDDNKEEWFLPLKSHIINELINNIYTTDTFTEEGTKMKMIDALSSINSNEQSLLSQPIMAAYRLLKMHYLYGKGDNKNVQTMAKRRFSYFLVELMAYIIKPQGDHEHELKLYYQYNEVLDTLLFDTYCGIPINGTAKSISVKDVSRLLGSNHASIYASVNSLSKLLNVEPNDLINKEFLTYIIYGLTSVPGYNKPMQIFTKLLGNSFFLNAEHQTLSDEVRQNINKDRFDKYFKAKDVNVPCYAFYNGIHSTPSKLYFNKTPLWNNDMNGVTMSVEMQALKLNEALGKKLKEWYGSVVPNSTSSHTNVHRTIAAVLEKEFPEENDTTNPDIVDSMVMMCLDELKKTRGEKGNMYLLDNIYACVYAVYDFCELRTKHKPKNFVDSPTGMYNVTKLRIELNKCGIEFSDTDSFKFDITKMILPQYMHEKFSHLDIHDILTRINSKYVQLQIHENYL